MFHFVDDDAPSGLGVYLKLAKVSRVFRWMSNAAVWLLIILQLSAGRSFAAGLSHPKSGDRLIDMQSIQVCPPLCNPYTPI